MSMHVSKYPNTHEIKIIMINTFHLRQRKKENIKVYLQSLL